MPNTPSFGFIDGIDWGNPDEQRDGLQVFNVRCRVPFSLPTPGNVVGRAAEERVFDNDDEVLDPAATGDPGSDDEFEMGNPLVSGIASSTSVDFFGTEMSLRALKLMAAQMKRGEGASVGVPYLPRHNLGLAGAMEWMDVIGRTVNAEVVPVEADQLQKPHNPAESQFMLRVTVMLFKDEPLAAALLRRVAPPPLGRGEAIGQSIGGWFTQLQILQNDDGDVERVIVLGVELDHLAVTRAPANPDAMGIISLRSSIERSSVQHRAGLMVSQLRAGHSVAVTRSVASAMDVIIASDGELEERHIVAAKETENTVIYQYLKGGKTVDDLQEDEMVNKSADDRATTEDVNERGMDEDEEKNIGEDDDDRRKGGGGEDLEEEGMDEDEDKDKRSAAPALDTSPPAAQDGAVTDAHRSALLPTTSPDTGTSVDSEEPAMSDISLDAIRSLFDDKLTPVIDRLQALEDSGAARATTETAEPAATTAEPLAVDSELRSQLEEAQKRAERAEAAAAMMAARPFRVGRAAGLSVPITPTTAGVFDGLVQRSRAEAPVLAAVAERMLPTITEENGAAAVTRNGLLNGLSALLNAAEADGIITNPALRSAWK